MSSQNYQRAQSMLLADKYNLTKSQFYAELAELANRYFEMGAISTDILDCGELQIVVTLSIKKVKECKRILA